MPRRANASRPNTTSVFGRTALAEAARTASIRRSISVASLSASVPGPDSLAEPPHRYRDVRQPGVRVHERGDSCPSQLRQDVSLAAVDDDQIRPEREDPFDVGIEQRPHSRQALDLRREMVEAADANDPRSRADREQHLGDRGDEGDDSGRSRDGLLRLASDSVWGDADDQADQEKDAQNLAHCECMPSFSDDSRPSRFASRFAIRAVAVSTAVEVPDPSPELMVSESATTERTARRSAP